jgi:uncharacterized membrane protein
VTAVAHGREDGAASAAAAEPAAQPGRAAAVCMLVGGIIGLLAALDLTIEKVKILLDPYYLPTCSISPILSCGSVMQTPQASAFGFPNSIIGIAAFTVVVVSGVLAVGKVAVPQWYWRGLFGGLVLGTVFVHWLIFQSVYRIGTLCPYCMAVWAVTIPLLATSAGPAFRGSRSRLGAAALSWRWSAVALWFVAVLLIVLAEFWDYWVTLV